MTGFECPSSSLERLTGQCSGIALLGTLDALVLGNQLGLAEDGITAQPNEVGLFVSWGATGSIEGNTASGNILAGAWVESDAATPVDVLFAGNRLGVDAGGTRADPQRRRHRDRGSGRALGQAGGLAANLISGNAESGVNVLSGPVTIANNIIGLDATGQTAIPNGTAGILVQDPGESPWVTVGGIAPGERNVIAGNGGPGVWVATYGPEDPVSDPRRRDPRQPRAGHRPDAASQLLDAAWRRDAQRHL